MLNITTAFDKCIELKCLATVNHSQFIVIDKEGRSEIIIDNLDSIKHPFFKVLNPNQKELNFLAIDHCLLHDCDPQKCDFSVFDETIFCFVEIKTAGSPTKRRCKKVEAIKKLRSTIEIFNDKKVALSGHELHVCLCVGFKRTFPTSKSSMQSHAKSFQDDFNASLIEGNEFTFN